jgi:hypothetical protein
MITGSQARLGGGRTLSTVFISYRRENTAGEARNLFNDLVERLGDKSVFMDVDSIALGRDFRSVLQETTASCDLMLVIIGRNWADAKDERGRIRLENPSDYVRLEIETALKRNIAVTPVLVQGAQMPAPEVLPAEIRDLAYRNGFELGHTRWESDVGEMIRRLGLDAPSVPASQTKGRRRLAWVVIGLACVVGLLGFDWLLGLNWLLVKVPRLPPGLEYVRAEKRLQRAGLTAEKASIPVDDEHSVPRVLDQEPEAGSTVIRGSAVKLTLVRQYIYPLVCRGGGVLGNGHGQSSSTDASDRLFRFERNLVAKATLDLKPGECSWRDRPMWSSEPDAILASDEEGVELTDALRLPNMVVFVCVINDKRRPRFIVVYYEPSLSFIDGQWRPKAECPNSQS